MPDEGKATAPSRPILTNLVPFIPLSIQTRRASETIAIHPSTFIGHEASLGTDVCMIRAMFGSDFCL